LIVRSVVELVIICARSELLDFAPEFELEKLIPVAPEGVTDEGLNVVGLEGDATNVPFSGRSIAGVVIGEVETKCSSMRGRAGD
jgi:hypothetical protein